MWGESGRMRWGVELAMYRYPPLSAALDQHLFDVGNRLSGVKPLRARPRAIENGVTPVEPVWIFKIVEALASCLVTTIRQPAPRLKQHRRAQEAICVPPVAGTT